MRKYILANYEEELNHQVIHMDQAVCYCPEFLASKKMHDYPSRKLQLARAVYRNELEANDYISDIVFSGILSRQGERWQNFRENPEDCTDAMILSRAMLLSKGCEPAAPDQLKDLLKKHQGHINSAAAWKLPTDLSSGMAILLDDAAAEGFAKDQKSFADWCQAQKISFINEARPVFLGFEYFACGLIEEGSRQLKQVIDTYEAMQAEEVLVLSAQAYYMLTTFAAKLGINVSFKVNYLPDRIKDLKTQRPAYVYAGSFNLRYLGYAEKLNAQLKNEKEEVIKTSAEFIPLVNGDVRVNRLTIWQRPVGPEYACFGTDKKMLSAICSSALEDIRKADTNLIVSYEPTAIGLFEKELPDYEIISYLRLL